MSSLPVNVQQEEAKRCRRTGGRQSHQRLRSEGKVQRDAAGHKEGPSVSLSPWSSSVVVVADGMPLGEPVRLLLDVWLRQVLQFAIRAAMTTGRLLCVCGLCVCVDRTNTRGLLQRTNDTDRRAVLSVMDDNECCVCLPPAWPTTTTHGQQPSSSSSPAAAAAPNLQGGTLTCLKNILDRGAAIQVGGLFRVSRLPALALPRSR